MYKSILVSGIAILLFAVVPSVSFAVGMKTLNGLGAADQFLATTTGATTMHMSILSAGNTHTFQWNATPWTIAQGGTGATSFTNGSVLFFSSGAFSQDNSNFFWDSVNHFLGIGNTAPRHALDVSGAMYSRLVLLPSGTASIDWNAGNVQSLTLNTNTTLAFSNGQAGGEYKLILKQDGTGGRIVTWPSDVQWANGIVPTLTASANGKDLISFVKDGDGFYLGSFKLNYATSSGATSSVVEFLVVAGGGGGSGSSSGGAGTSGGGGAGGYQAGFGHTVVAQSYAITVGTGGLGATSPDSQGSNGGNSIFDTVTATGGGGGASRNTPGVNGGSGGGGGGGSAAGAGGIGSQGNNGGSGLNISPYVPGGGGGSSSAGGNGSGTTGGSGGIGTANSISGSSVVYTGGGGGSDSGFGASSPGVGGIGGGGAGGSATTDAGNGTANMGGGGGGGGSGAGHTKGGDGGSGVVIISYPTGSITATGGTITTAGGNTIHTFTSGGTFTVTAIN